MCTIPSIDISTSSPCSCMLFLSAPALKILILTIKLQKWCLCKKAEQPAVPMDGMIYVIFSRSARNAEKPIKKRSKTSSQASLDLFRSPFLRHLQTFQTFYRKQFKCLLHFLFEAIFVLIVKLRRIDNNAISIRKHVSANGPAETIEDSVNAWRSFSLT